MDPIDILVIPDAHARPDTDLSRFSLLGRAICGIRPDKVVCLGDIGDFESLSSFDRPGSKQAEGRRFAADLDSVREAQTLIFDELDKFNRHRRGNAALEVDAWHLTLGNHEQRLQRAIDADPAHLDGVISMDSITDGFPWIVHPYLEPAWIAGIAFAHSFATGVAGRPASTAQQILLKHFTSAVAGHLHTLSFATGTKTDGTRINAAICGMYDDTEQTWCGPQVQRLWQSGIAVLRHCDGTGGFDFEWWSHRRLKRAFWD